MGTLMLGHLIILYNKMKPTTNLMLRVPVYLRSE
jgi:hypothetical protein